MLTELKPIDSNMYFIKLTVKKGRQNDNGIKTDGDERFCVQSSQTAINYKLVRFIADVMKDPVDMNEGPKGFRKYLHKKLRDHCIIHVDKELSSGHEHRINPVRSRWTFEIILESENSVVVDIYCYVYRSQNLRRSGMVSIKGKEFDEEKARKKIERIQSSSERQERGPEWSFIFITYLEEQWETLKADTSPEKRWVAGVPNTSHGRPDVDAAHLAKFIEHLLRDGGNVGYLVSMMREQTLPEMRDLSLADYHYLAENCLRRYVQCRVISSGQKMIRGSIKTRSEEEAREFSSVVHPVRGGPTEATEFLRDIIEKPYKIGESLKRHSWSTEHNTEYRTDPDDYLAEEENKGRRPGWIYEVDYQEGVKADLTIAMYTSDFKEPFRIRTFSMLDYLGGQDKDVFWGESDAKLNHLERSRILDIQRVRDSASSRMAKVTRSFVNQAQGILDRERAHWDTQASPMLLSFVVAAEEEETDKRQDNDKDSADEEAEGVLLH